MAPIYMPLRGLRTRRKATAYNTYLAGRRFVKELPAWSGFTINDTKLYNGSLWVQSGLGDWYSYSDDLFDCRDCLTIYGRTTRVMVYPNRPAGGVSSSQLTGLSNWDLIAWQINYAGGDPWLTMRHNYGDARNPVYGPSPITH